MLNIFRKSKKLVLASALAIGLSGCVLLQSVGINAGKNVACQGLPEGQYVACDVITWALLAGLSVAVAVAASNDDNRGGPVAAGTD